VCDCVYSRDSSVSLSTEAWPTSVTSPGERRASRYDNGPSRDPPSRHVVALQVPGQLLSADVMDRAARRHQLAAAAAAAVANDNNDVAMAAMRHDEMSRTAVRPWLMH